MSRAPGIFNIAALVSVVAAMVNLIGVAQARSDRIVVPTVVGGVLWLAFAVGLKARKRWVAYFAFLLAIVSGLFVYSLLGEASPVAQWLKVAIVFLNLVLTAVMFLIIWRKPDAP